MQRRRIISSLTAVAVFLSQLALSPHANAAPTPVSGAARLLPPPSITQVQSFQPDLFTGRATTSIPIVVPPGRRGIQPNLSLTYSSTSRNGWLGVGWSLELGGIEISTKDGPPSSSADAFNLVMQGVHSELVKVGPGLYRAKDETAFLRVLSQSPTGWEVTDRTGTRYFFGVTSNAQVQKNGVLFRWNLEKVLDVFGNSLTISYLIDENQAYPNRIQYTANEASGLLPTSQIDFIPEGRPDKETSFRPVAFGITTAQRLKQIVVTTNQQFVRRYDLAYTTSARTGRSLLQSITQVGMDKISALPAITFSYQSQAMPTYTIGQSDFPNTRTFLSGDVDGNGISDRISFDPATGSWIVVLNTYVTTGPTLVWQPNLGGPTSIPLVGDWDGDGLTDIGIAENGVWTFARSTGTRFQIDPSLTKTFSTIGPITGDFNGDGRIDLASFNRATGQWLFTLPGLDIPSWGADTEGMTGDFNGDGLTDLAIRTPAGDIWTRYGTGAGWSAPALRRTGWPNLPTSATDIDGDGLADVVAYDPPSGQVLYARGVGLDFAPTNSVLVTFGQPSTQDQFTLADFNGDGLLDPIVVHQATGLVAAAISSGQIADLLGQWTNGIGGITTLTYQSSSQQGNSKLPFVIPVVQQVTMSNGLGHSAVMTYRYTSGLYQQREFRGFGHVEARDAAGTVTATDFLQDSLLKGHVAQTLVNDSLGRLWTKTMNTWSDREFPAGVHFSRLDQVTQSHYDGDSVPRQIRTRVVYDDDGDVVWQTEDGDLAVTGDERTTHTTYARNPTAWILGLPVLTEQLNANNTTVAQTRRTFDLATGKLTMEEQWLNTTNQWLPTIFSYDPYGNPTSATDPLQRTARTVYDPTGTFVVQRINALGQTETASYDPRFSVVTSVTDANGVSSRKTYDVFGRVVAVVGPTDTEALPTISYSYSLTPPIRSTACLRMQSGGASVLCTSVFKDGLGRVIQTREPAQDPTKQIVKGMVALNALGQVDQQWAEGLDTTSSIYIPPSQIPNLPPPWTYTYDPLGRLTTSRRPDGAETKMAYQKGVESSTDARGNTTKRTMDVYGRLISVEEPGGALTQYQYDALDHLTTLTNAKNQTTMLTFDSLGRKLTMTDPDMGNWTYAYDAVGNLRQQTDARGVVTSMAYDTLNRLVTKTYTVPAGVASTPAVTYTYDQLNAGVPTANSIGRVVKVTNGTATRLFSYDSLGRTISDTVTIGTGSYPFRRTYDLLGRALTLTYPDNEVATYTYNAQGPSTIKLGAQTVLSKMTYDPVGRPTLMTYGNGVTTTSAFNLLSGELGRLTTKTAAGGLIQDLTYTWDLAGNVTQLADGLRATSQTFGYDALNRLTSASGPYGAKTYGYDRLGNLINKEGVTMTYGRPHGVTVTSLGLNLSYDAVGSLLKKVLGTTTTSYTWDAEQRLVQLTAGTTSTYRYDAEGRRVTQKESTGTTTYVSPDYHVTPTGPVKYVSAGEFRIAAKDATGVRYYHTDHLGSVVAVTGPTGQSLEQVQYLPYGATYQRTGPIKVPHQFTGQLVDTSGLYYYNARYYDPSLGRFLSADPTVQHPEDPQDLTRYSYARNNPLTYVDPSGYGFRKWLRVVFAAVAIIVLAIVAVLQPELFIGLTKLGMFVVQLAVASVAAAVGDQVGKKLDQQRQQQKSPPSDSPTSSPPAAGASPPQPSLYSPKLTPLDRVRVPLLKQLAKELSTINSELENLELDWKGIRDTTRLGLKLGTSPDSPAGGVPAWANWSQPIQDQLSDKLLQQRTTEYQQQKEYLGRTIRWLLEH